MGLAPSTVHRHLVSLREYGYVTTTGDKYRVGLQFLTIGGYIQRQITEFLTIKDKVDSLAEETGERAQFIVEENGERVYLYTEVGQSAVQTGAYLGKRGPIHTSAAGKAILAELPQSRVKAIINEQDLPTPTSNSIADREELYESLEDIRDRGYAVNKQETTEGVHAIGAAITNGKGSPIGALSVSGPANRITEDHLENDLRELVLGVANELNLHVKHAV